MTDDERALLRELAASVSLELPVSEQFVELCVRMWPDECKRLHPEEPKPSWWRLFWG